jgi:broad-specificity NMP kinase
MLTVVTGPPCSGKSTYVRERAKPGDIVIDFDTLAQALGSPTAHDHNKEIRLVTIDARRSAIASAVSAHLRGHPVWIVDTDIRERLPMYRAACADVVTLRVDRAELHRRAQAERPPRWHELIERHLRTTARRRRPAELEASREW